MINHGVATLSYLQLGCIMFIMLQLLRVTEKCHAPQDPVVRADIAAEAEGSDVSQVSATWFLVHLGKCTAWDRSRSPSG